MSAEPDNADRHDNYAIAFARVEQMLSIPEEIVQPVQKPRSTCRARPHNPSRRRAWIDSSAVAPVNQHGCSGMPARSRQSFPEVSRFLVETGRSVFPHETRHGCLSGNFQSH